MCAIMNLDDPYFQLTSEMRQCYSIEINPHFKTLISELVDLQTFVSELSSLVGDKNLCFTFNHKLLFPDIIITSVASTFVSIIQCCKYGNLSDAYTLLRKAKDDMFFYLYLITVTSRSSRVFSTIPDKHDKNIENWLNNKLSHFHIDHIIDFFIASTNSCDSTISSKKCTNTDFKNSEDDTLSNLKEAIEKYNIKDTLIRIKNKMNNFTHTNGIGYCNTPLNRYRDGLVDEACRNFLLEAKYIIMAFLFLLIISNGSLVMSDDYIGACDCNVDPIDGSQYWVVPFVLEFIQQNKNLLGDDCDKFLDAMSYMDILPKKP